MSPAAVRKRIFPISSQNISEQNNEKTGHSSFRKREGELPTVRNFPQGMAQITIDKV